MKSSVFKFKFLQKPWVRSLSNKYILASLLFAIWMIFLDTHSILIHRELNKEIKNLERGIEYYSSELERDKAFLNELQNHSETFEKFAREQYWLKKPHEEIYLIEREE